MPAPAAGDHAPQGTEALPRGRTVLRPGEAGTAPSERTAPFYFRICDETLERTNASTASAPAMAYGTTRRRSPTMTSPSPIIAARMATDVMTAKLDPRCPRRKPSAAPMLGSVGVTTG